MAEASFPLVGRLAPIPRHRPDWNPEMASQVQAVKSKSSSQTQEALDAYAADKREWSKQSPIRSRRVQAFLNRLDGGE